MGVIEFLCDKRFHSSYVLPPNEETGRNKSHRFSYSDFGDPTSNAVVLLMGGLMGMRLSYTPLDQLAKVYNVRIIHIDRPGVGGTEAIELDKRIQLWLEIVPQLLAHLNISHVSLASHSGGDIFLLNTMLTYPHLLNPQNPYVCFFAPYVHPAHSKVTTMLVTSLLPAPMIGTFGSLARFVNDNVIPLKGISGAMAHGVKASFPRSNITPAPVTLNPLTTQSREPSIDSRGITNDLNLDDPEVVEELRKHITTFLFAESLDGVSADAQLFMKKPRSVPWCSPSMVWSDIDYFVPLFSRIIKEDPRSAEHSKTWVLDAFHAETDDIVGEKGAAWFDACWVPGSTQQHDERSYEYSTAVVKGSDHNDLMDPAFGASELWLQRVRDSFAQPSELDFDTDASSSTRRTREGRKRMLQGFVGKVKHLILVRGVRKSSL